ncbi:alpha/beta hydrolase fold domain-containing protein [Nonomuraea pusilla]|uniref:alpha/beta hydrolase fold domain-containing protein n=1 Tax=Nonomuraea pusilla TaxID=46177 RepID=UPI00342A13F6
MVPRRGQVLGYAAQDDPALKHLVLKVGCIVASVDHRLAPEAPAPPACSADARAAFPLNAPA